MEKLISAITDGFSQFGIRDAVDIVIIAFLVYELIMITRETRAAQVLKGLGIMLLASWLCTILKIQTTAWILDQLIKAGAIVLIIIFQPELRRALEQLGRGKFFDRSGMFAKPETDRERVISEIAIALTNLAVRKVGALIIIERRTGLADIISTGTRIQAIISAALIENIFEPNTPLHDGAIIIRGHIIKAATCYLPLTENRDISKELGTRHRAAIGVTEVSDAIAVVVSEETGKISFVLNGEIFRALTPEKLRQMLIKNLIHETTNDRRKAKRISLFKGKKRIGG